jgi:hypothetical protein
MQTGKVVNFIAATVVLASIAVLYLTLVGLPPHLDARPHRALGQAVAQETLKLLGAGGRVMLIARDTTTFRNPAADAQLKQFHQAIKKANVKVALTNLIKLDPLRVAAAPAGDLIQYLRKGSEKDVVVSFLALTPMPDRLIDPLPEKRPKLIAVCTGNSLERMEIDRLFERKVVHAAIVSRADIGATQPASDDPRAWFEYLYVVLTSATSGTSQAEGGL